MLFAVCSYTIFISVFVYVNKIYVYVYVYESQTDVWEYCKFDNSVQMGADVEKNPGATCTLTVQNSNCTICLLYTSDAADE